MAVDGATVYDSSVSASAGPVQITSNAVQTSDNPSIQMSQKCGDTPLALTVENVSISSQSNTQQSNPTTTDAANGSSGTGSPGGNGGNGGAGSGSGSGSGSNSSGKSSKTGNFACTNEPATYVVGFIAGLIALLA